MAEVFKQISIGCLLITGSQLYECILIGNLSRRLGKLYSSPMNKILPVKAWICIGIRDVKDFSCSCHLTSYSFFYRKSAENKDVCQPQYELLGKKDFSSRVCLGHSTGHLFPTSIILVLSGEKSYKTIISSNY